MKKFVLCSALALSLLGMSSVVACGGEDGPKKVDDGTGEDWELQAGPAWFEQRADEKDGRIYAYGQSQRERETSAARDSARANATTAMSSFLEVKVKSMLERYNSSIAEGGPAVESRLTEQLARIVTNNTIHGFKIDKSEVSGKYVYARGYITSEGLSNALKTSKEVQEYTEAKVRERKERFAEAMDREVKGIVNEAANRSGPSLK